jgi:hypothetical protein
VIKTTVMPMAVFTRVILTASSPGSWSMLLCKQANNGFEVVLPLVVVVKKGSTATNQAVQIYAEVKVHAMF